MGRANTPTEDAQAEQTFICCVPFSTDIDGTPRTVRDGEILRGDDPAYLAAPVYFAPVGTPHNERPKVADFVGEGVTTERPPRAPDGWRRDWHGGGKGFGES
jgi:hypothetical protein